MEIASNDGFLLQHLVAAAVAVLGIHGRPGLTAVGVSGEPGRA